MANLFASATPPAALNPGGDENVLLDQLRIQRDLTARDLSRCNALVLPVFFRIFRPWLCVLLALLVPVLLAVSQRMIGQSVFEWGNHKTFSGILQTTPCPHLLVPRPGNADGPSRFSTYYLVAPWKFGLNREALAPFDGQAVSLKGTLIYRGNQTMVETKLEWITVSTNDQRRARSDAPYQFTRTEAFLRMALCWLAGGISTGVAG